MSMNRQFSKREFSRYLNSITYVTVSGDTFKHKDIIRKNGLKWNKNKKAWTGNVNKNSLETLESLDGLVVRT